ncbi:MAG: holo-ACP synthase [Clostridiales Family XIII bacterium]|jgi:holo-[acyl-carrier protein] synthase|nr:holo-ACP synthase [Clostridiales Family XIII bacterium]
MIFGAGVDILDLKRIEGVLSEGDPFVRKTFTETERKTAPESDAARREYFATRFAAKEAVFKSLKADSNAARLSDIEIATGDNGEPVCTLKGELKKCAESNGIVSVELSISKEDKYVIAFAVSTSR